MDFLNLYVLFYNVQKLINSLKIILETYLIRHFSLNDIQIILVFHVHCISRMQIFRNIVERKLSVKDSGLIE